MTPICRQTQVTIPYKIHKYSSYSSSYDPENIKINNPSDQASRWSSNANNQDQFLLLELESLSILQVMIFGKFCKIHVCNLKEFKVFCGIDPENMFEVLHSGLRNDTEPEAFSIDARHRDTPFPCKFVKICPLMAWGSNFNFSIWYLEMKGIVQKDLVQRCLAEYNLMRQTAAQKLILKYLKNSTVFPILEKEFGMTLQNDFLQKLSSSLRTGDFQTSEKLIENACSEGMFQQIADEGSFGFRWTRILEQGPEMRGGHQMCADSSNKLIYLFGGWNGTNDLGDLWVYSTESARWKCLSTNVQLDGGPSPRSCHKMIFHPKRNALFILGKYIEAESRGGDLKNGDFFYYDIPNDSWHQISHSTKDEGGPELIYDHQMELDEAKDTLYIFGGRNIHSNMEANYSGLYSYHIATRKWTLIRSDDHQPPATPYIKARIGHSMLFNANERCLYIFSGQRVKDYLGDFYKYNVDTDTVEYCLRDMSRLNGPEGGFTQRSLIVENDIYVLSGLMREKNSTVDTVRNCLWHYNTIQRKWTTVYKNENTDPQYWLRMQNVEPCPRYAHQFVFDGSNFFVFGGNPGDLGSEKLRLNDFWKLEIWKPSPETIARKIKFLIRKQKYFVLIKGLLKCANKTQSKLFTIFSTIYQSSLIIQMKLKVPSSVI